MTNFFNIYKQQLIQEIDAANKLKTTNGIILYHASNNDFDYFDINKAGYNGTNKWGNYFYFFDDKDATKSYGNIIYTVEIPKKNGMNYLQVNKEVSDTIINSTISYIFDIIKDDYDEEDHIQLDNELTHAFLTAGTDGGLFIGTLLTYINESQMKDLFNKIGVIGLIDPDTNSYTIYVIFDPVNIKILNKERINQE